MLGEIVAYQYSSIIISFSHTAEYRDCCWDQDWTPESHWYKIKIHHLKQFQDLKNGYVTHSSPSLFRSLSLRGICPAGLCPRGSLSRRCLSGGGSVQGVSVRETPPTETPCTATRRRYAFYWNAFLLSKRVWTYHFCAIICFVSLLLFWDI